ncbi:MAG: hypothetical protein KIC54_01310 [Clostridium sp.]|nr:hypothetical protein [Clostridium sp.]
MKITYREIIKKLGFKNFILYYLIRYLEILINLPYKILKLIIEIFYTVFDLLDSLFYKRNLIVISNISKRANSFRIKCQNILNGGKSNETNNIRKRSK